MKYFVTVEGRPFEVELGPEGARIDGEAAEVDLAHVEGTEVRHLLLDGDSHRIVAGKGPGGKWVLHLRGRRYVVEAVDERTRTIREMTGTGAGPVGPLPVRASMPGLVVKVEVQEGDRVAEGQGVVIVEAMKMENELKVEAPGVVAQVHVAPGDTVEKDQILIDLAPLPDAAEEAE